MKKSSQKIDKKEFPDKANDLTDRAKKLLYDLIGDWIKRFKIKEEDGYYYTHVNIGLFNLDKNILLDFNI